MSLADVFKGLPYGGEQELTASIVLRAVHVVNKIIYNEISLGQAKLCLNSSWSEAILKQS